MNGFDHHWNWLRWSLNNFLYCLDDRSVNVYRHLVFNVNWLWFWNWNPDGNWDRHGYLNLNGVWYCSVHFIWYGDRFSNNSNFVDLLRNLCFAKLGQHHPPLRSVWRLAQLDWMKLRWFDDHSIVPE